MGALKYILRFRWANVLSEIAGYLSAVALVFATLIMTYGVALRYFLGSATVWQTETSVYLLVFVTFVGAAYGLKHHAHVGVDLLVDRLPPRPQLAVRLITGLLALFVVGAVIWTSYGTWWEATEGGFRTPTALRAPLSVVYAILPLGMLLVALQYIAFLIEGVERLIAGGDQVRTAAIMGQGNAELATALEEESRSTADVGHTAADGSVVETRHNEEGRDPS
jgi:TRAP-type C4-dicarboxylate transport system permease small subunit